MSKALKLDENNFEEEVINADKKVLVDFWADWCGPCKMIAPILEEIAAEYDDRVKVVKVNVDENQELASRYQVMSIPTLLVFEGGNKVKEVVGYQPKEELLQALEID